MGLLEWATTPWGKLVPIHIAWFLIWVAVIAGFLFFIVHATYLRYFAKQKEFAGAVSPAVAARIPDHVPRHSLAARLFHWIMAASMFTLLFTAFLPKVGVQFNWVTYHWIAGTVLTASIIFHIIHASFFMDFWAIWPDRIDLRDAVRRMLRAAGKPEPPPDRFAKYPLENKLYHGAIIAAGLSAIVTGVLAAVAMIESGLRGIAWGNTNSSYCPGANGYEPAVFAAATPPLPPYSTITANATCGLSAGAKPMNQAWLRSTRVERITSG